MVLVEFIQSIRDIESIKHRKIESFHIGMIEAWKGMWIYDDDDDSSQMESHRAAFWRHSPPRPSLPRWSFSLNPSLAYLGQIKRRVTRPGEELFEQVRCNGCGKTLHVIFNWLVFTVRTRRPCDRQLAFPKWTCCARRNDTYIALCEKYFRRLVITWRD